MKSSTADGKSLRSLKSTKQRQLNRGSKVLMLKVERGRKMKKEFRLYKESEIFREGEDGTNIVEEHKLVEHEVDDDFATDEETVQDNKKKCLKELKEAIRNFCRVDNPFELVRNIRDPDSETGLLAKPTPSYVESVSHSEEPSE